MSAEPRGGVTVLYARVPVADQKSDLERQLGRLVTYAAGAGLSVELAVTEIG